jgi:fatty acid desaturase
MRRQLGVAPAPRRDYRDPAMPDALSTIPEISGPEPVLRVDLAGLTERSDCAGAMRLGAHLAAMAATASLVFLAQPLWYLLLPAMTLHGVTIVTLFAPMHECTHRTAFASRSANLVVGWLAGVLSFYNSTFYWHFHSWHHRYTQDPARDPELMIPKARNRREYLREIGAINFWWRRALDYPRLALGLMRGLPFVPEGARRPIALSMAAQLAVYLAAAAAVALGWHAVLYYWLLPVVLAQPLLRAVLIAEHTGCSLDGNGLSNTRTTLARWPLRLLMWNMPFHAEHHLYPAVPFHRLPALHLRLRERLAHVAPGYRAANRDILSSFPVAA